MHLKWQLFGQKYGVNMEDRNAFKREMIKREMKENGNSATEERGTL